MSVFTLISQDENVIIDATGETGGPDYNLGREFSRRFTWASDNTEEPFVSMTVTTFVNGSTVTATEDGLERKDLEYGDLEDKLKELEVHTEAYTKVCREANSSAEVDAWLDKNPIPVLFFWNEITEVMVHHELDDLGGSEIRCDYQNGEGSTFTYDSIAKAEAAAEGWIKGHSVDDFAPEWA